MCVRVRVRVRVRACACACMHACMHVCSPHNLLSYQNIKKTRPFDWFTNRKIYDSRLRTNLFKEVAEASFYILFDILGRLNFI